LEAEEVPMAASVIEISTGEPLASSNQSDGRVTVPCSMTRPSKASLSRNPGRGMFPVTRPTPVAATVSPVEPIRAGARSTTTGASSVQSRIRAAWCGGACRTR
jgi:hypothetical protein